MQKCMDGVTPRSRGKRSRDDESVNAHRCRRRRRRLAYNAQAYYDSIILTPYFITRVRRGRLINGLGEKKKKRIIKRKKNTNSIRRVRITPRITRART